ncbi:MAG TPA: M48 family metallopeptidase [Flavisolibacter sp.]|nr:M48 family metallopeptidase [Flavisolibacter sp.]
MKGFFSILVIILFASCNLVDSKSGKKSSKDMTYSYACLDSAVSNDRTARIANRANDIIRNFTVDESQITDAVQNQYGEAFHKDALETKTFVLLNDPAINTQLQKLMNDLLAQRENPSQINYAIYLLDDKQINAFTFGGRIYVTKAMYDKCKGSTALLYSIVGHEIGHSEKGHIKKTIQEMMLANKVFGENNGDFFFYIKKLLTGSFNQKNELEADYYGTDLTYRLNQDVCSAVAFWKEMGKSENQYSKLEDFFRTHPFSNLRAQCLQDHIQRNFGTACAGQ